MAKHLTLFLLILAGAWGAISALAGPTLQRFTFTEPHMGTTVRIVLYASDEMAAKRAADAAFAHRRIEQDPERLRSGQRVDVPVQGRRRDASVDLFCVLQQAEKYAKLSDGAFDISIGPVVRLWRKAQDRRDAERRRHQGGAGTRRLAQDSARARRRMVRLMLMGMLLDLGGIAKGYAADAAIAVLRRHGITQGLVALGGDIAVSDPPPNAAGWRIAVAPLRGGDAPPRHHVFVKNAGVSTAGDLHQAVEIDGKRYAHIIDPRTGLGLVGRRSATVIAPNATTSDGLDTGMCVMGPERGLAMIEKLDGVAALYVYETETGEETAIASKRWAQYIDLEKK